MTASVLSLSDSQSILQAARVLADGGIVVAPTETRYGLLVRGDNNLAVQKLFEIKGRQFSSPTALFVSGKQEISRLGIVTPIVQDLMNEFLPGPLTLVLTSRIDWPAPRVVDGKIGIRLSSSPLIRQLVEAVEAPLTATSANLSGQPDRETIHDIQSDFGSQVDLYIDGGRLSGPVSTVVECTNSSYRILRVGAIPIEEIERITGRD
jgi:L-threonylcarbamoyladenylate synthase